MTKPKPRQAKAQTRQIEMAKNLDRQHRRCRLVGHSWHRIQPDREPQFGVLMVWECERCTTKRDDIVMRNSGELLSRAYRYATGYQIRIANRSRGGRALPTTALRIAEAEDDNW